MSRYPELSFESDRRIHFSRRGAIKAGILVAAGGLTAAIGLELAGREPRPAKKEFISLEGNPFIVVSFPEYDLTNPHEKYKTKIVYSQDVAPLLFNAIGIDDWSKINLVTYEPDPFEPGKSKTREVGELLGTEIVYLIRNPDYSNNPILLYNTPNISELERLDIELDPSSELYGLPVAVPFRGVETEDGQQLFEVNASPDLEPRGFSVGWAILKPSGIDELRVIGYTDLLEPKIPPR